MGMAASQARLLSITSRMSDNELRAQLINNAKMRLTTDSSRVSDEYIAALNQTQFMFSNFDTQGNEQLQNLTFNSLTAYSSYNNQYGIVNNGGELLVSSADASNFEKSKNLEAFLGCYGLSQDTTYFDKFKNETVYYYDKYGNKQELGITVGNMKDIFEGNIDSEGIDHYGYKGSLNSYAYGDYSKLVQNYRNKKSEYRSVINEYKNKFMDGEIEINGHKLSAGGKNFETLFNEVSAISSDNFSAGTAKQYRQYMLELMNVLQNTAEPAKSANVLSDSSDVFMQGLKINSSILANEIGSKVHSYRYESATYAYAKVNNSTGAIEAQYTDPYAYPYTTIYLTEDKPLTATDPLEIEGLGTRYETTIGLGDTYKKVTIPEDESYSFVPLYTYKDAEGQTQYTIDGSKEGATRYKISDDPSVIDEEFTLTQEFMMETLKYLYSYFKDNAFANLNDQVFITNGPDEIKEKREAYYKASQNLAAYIYGENGVNITEDYYDYLDDPSWVLSDNQTNRSVAVDYTYTDNDGNEITYQVFSTDIEKTHYNPYKYPTTTPPETIMEVNGIQYNVNYQTVKDVFLIECMLDSFGEPKYTWVDENNPDENAEVKAQWYTNLYERMKKGYKEISQNLMSSQEWLKFAFESGLVHMEQVDKSNNWVSTMYSNCSNITESTVDVDVTIAEAKYKREMNKIQAKDKQYDIELKNIDTEHTSLQTEYESIKSVIDKNVERNFKMFQA